MHIADFLTADDILTVRAADKRELFRVLAGHMARNLAWDPANLLATLLQREALGSTGVGGGIALPHARFATLTRPQGLFAKLARPVEFGAIDDLPVDLVFLLLLPSEAPEMQVKALACVARRLKMPGLPDRLRRAGERTAIFDLLVAP